MYIEGLLELIRIFVSLPSSYLQKDRDVIKMVRMYIQFGSVQITKAAARAKIQFFFLGC